MTKKECRSRSSDGLPIDAKEWTEDDWRDLHKAIETVKRKVAKRHEPRSKQTPEADRRTTGGGPTAV